MAIDYSKLDRIEVFSQLELDAVPDDFKGQIIVCSKEPVTISKKYKQKVLIAGATYALVKNDAVVDAVGKIGLPETIYEPSTQEIVYGKFQDTFAQQVLLPYIQLCDNAKLEMSGYDKELSYVTIKAKDNSTAIVMGCAYVIAEGNSFISAFGHASVEQYDNAVIWAYEHCILTPNENGRVTVMDPDTVQICQAKGKTNAYQWWQESAQRTCTIPMVFAEELNV